jgi:hypothetical protein
MNTLSENNKQSCTTRVIPNEIRIGDKMRHKLDNCPFTVTGITKDKVQLKGDWSGGTWPINSISWVSWDEVERWE